MDVKKVLSDFLPDKIFDAHMHLYESKFAGEIGMLPDNVYIEDFYSAMHTVMGNRRFFANIISMPGKKIISGKNGEFLKASDEFLYKELAKNSDNVGEILVLPDETEESIEKRIKSKQICGFRSGRQSCK